ncbi:aminodeoxychorismate synthase component I [Lacihabitans sp. CS3-21]|uniref:aminodeoxychorismate synthase component I n=1 Tax=Lacihabitans sp. CS3-21 TaxID=2487332 RepID=UPI0020CE3EB6|nr:aminodeoxychorismate synthase component I [Lacihabitans sp. CS3-21]
MHKLSEKDTVLEMNKLGQLNCPFLFIIGFDKTENLVIPLDEISPEEIKYAFKDEFSVYQNFVDKDLINEPEISSEMISFGLYEKAFDFVKYNLELGNSFLTNLTVSNPIKVNISFEKIINFTKAKYKLCLKDEFVCFSPESFVSVNKNGKISSFPMKGTIDANVKDAENDILNDPKELYEHTTIVDLIRNDLSKICEKVWVERFRYIDKIRRNSGQELLQVSSEVCGQLPKDWKNNIGDWFFELLPAGSISGAPKEKTLEIIREAENDLHQKSQRNYYTGVFGLFDGEILTSAVMIRFIEKNENGLVFKSGGGITSRSDARKEYEELNQKIYVPVF